MDTELNSRNKNSQSKYTNHQEIDTSDKGDKKKMKGESSEEIWHWDVQLGQPPLRQCDETIVFDCAKILTRKLSIPQLVLR